MAGTRFDTVRRGRSLYRQFRRRLPIPADMILLPCTSIFEITCSISICSAKRRPHITSRARSASRCSSDGVHSLAAGPRIELEDMTMRNKSICEGSCWGQWYSWRRRVAASSRGSSPTSATALADPIMALDMRPGIDSLISSTFTRRVRAREAAKVRPEAAAAVTRCSLKRVIAVVRPGGVCRDSARGRFAR